MYKLLLALIVLFPVATFASDVQEKTQQILKFALSDNERTIPLRIDEEGEKSIHLAIQELILKIDSDVPDERVVPALRKIKQLYEGEYYRTHRGANISTLPSCFTPSNIRHLVNLLKQEYSKHEIAWKALTIIGRPAVPYLVEAMSPKNVSFAFVSKTAEVLRGMPLNAGDVQAIKILTYHLAKEVLFDKDKPRELIDPIADALLRVRGIDSSTVEISGNQLLVYVAPTLEQRREISKNYVIKDHSLITLKHLLLLAGYGRFEGK